MSGQHVTLDWGKEKVHLASGHRRIVVDREFEEALCGYFVALTPKEGTEDEVDREFICKRCRKIAGSQETKDA